MFCSILMFMWSLVPTEEVGLRYIGGCAQFTQSGGDFLDPFFDRRFRVACFGLVPSFGLDNQVAVSRTPNSRALGYP